MSLLHNPLLGFASDELETEVYKPKEPTDPSVKPS
jgi:hypothetical protein